MTGRGILEIKRRAIETADIDERLRKVEEAQAGAPNDRSHW
jgi:hypothetical protein